MKAFFFLLVPFWIVCLALTWIVDRWLASVVKYLVAL